MKVSIIIPAHNEEKRIENTLREYLDYFERLRENNILDYEIIVVLNACKDDTSKIVGRYTCESLKMLEFQKGGKGFAVIEGFKESLKGDADLIGFVDADMATKPEYFYDLVRKIGGNGGIIASRYVKGSRVYPKNTFARILASRVYNMVIRAILLIPYRDTQCGAKLFTREAVESCVKDIGMTQLAFDMELLYKIRNKGFIIKEVPTVWSDKEYSTINFWQSGPWMTLAVVRLRILNSPLKGIVGIYDRVMGSIHRRTKR